MDTTLPRSLFVEALERAGLDPEALHTDYSDRAMHGATCPALYLDSHAEGYAFMAALGAALLAGYEAGVAEAQALVEVAQTTRTDSMGLGIVIYWPGLQLEALEGVEALFAAAFPEAALEEHLGEESNAAHLVDTHGWLPPMEGSSPSDVEAQHRIAHEQTG